MRIYIQVYSYSTKNNKNLINKSISESENKFEDSLIPSLSDSESTITNNIGFEERSTYAQQRFTNICI